MNIENETKIEYKVITLFLIIISLVVVVVMIGLFSDLIKLQATEDAFQIIDSSATTESISFTIENTHSNDLVLQQVTVDGQKCHICLNSPLIVEDEHTIISCANVKHESNSYQHTLSLEYSDEKDTYRVTSQELISGVVSQTFAGQNNLIPIYEKILFSPTIDEVISDVKSNSCPQILITGSSRDQSQEFDLFLYSFDKQGEKQEMKTWDLHEFDTGSSIALTPFGKTLIYGHTYQQTQGGDGVLLTTDGYTNEFHETIVGSAANENAKTVFIDEDNYKYLITEVVGSSKKILIQKQDTNTLVEWSAEIPLSKLETFLTAEFNDGRITVLISGKNAITSNVHIYDTYGTKLSEKKISAIIRSMSFDSENNAILVGEITGQADTDAVIYKFNQNWQLIWTSKWGDSDNEEYSDVVISPNDEIYVVGFFEIERNDFRSFFHKYDVNGRLADSYLFRAPQSLRVSDVELTNEGLYVIGESFDGNQQDIYIAKFE